MEKAWIASGCVAFLIFSGYSNTGFTGFVVCSYWFTILIIVLLWIMLLLTSQFRLDQETVMDRLTIILLFLGLAAFPVFMVLGIWLISYLDERLE